MSGLTEILAWAMCNCNVWQITPEFGIGHCGRCGTKAEMIRNVPWAEEGKQAAIQAFIDTHGKEPEPFEEVWHAPTLTEGTTKYVQ